MNLGMQRGEFTLTKRNELERIIMADDCIFCKLANGVIPVEHVLSNEDAVIIKDANPIAPHHMLVIAKPHYPDLGYLLLANTEEGKSDRNLLCSMFSLIDDYVSMHLWHPQGGYRVVTNKGPDAGQSVKHLHFHLLGGSKLKNDFGA